MASQKLALNEEVTKRLDNINHPKRTEIEQLRKDILSANDKLSENIKWNGPNYSYDGEDRITMKIHPPHQIQLIFHRGAKVQEQPIHRLITDNSGLLKWKTNDRAVATFNNNEELQSQRSLLNTIINDWINATSGEK